MWLLLHITFAVIGECFLALALVMGLFYLLQEKRLKNKEMAIGLSHELVPSLDVLDRFQYKLLLFGFWSLTIGIIIGSIWAFYVWGKAWFLNPKQLWMFSGWMVYAIILKIRQMTGFRGKRIVSYSLIAFSLVLFAAWHGYFEGLFL